MIDALNSRVHTHKERHSLLWRFHIDLPLLLGLMAICGVGLLILHSAGGEARVHSQLLRYAIGFAGMIVVAQVPPRLLKAWAPGFFAVGVMLLIVVAIFGAVGKGAQRWIELGFIRFQPSELMKLAVPMLLAWYFSERPLPPRLAHVFVAAGLMALPVVLIALQPDFDYAILISASGFLVLWLAGLSWKILLALGALAAAAAPALWFFYMRDFQRQRVLTFLDPTTDPLGAGYHIIQSKIALGSGGLYGKGYFQGTQSQLEFVPERHTDFIFAVLGEEFGFLGALVLFALYAFVVIRCLYIANSAQETFTRLLAGALGMTFFVYIFINIGMVSGVLPVVGVPLPLISFGGSSSVVLLAGFGLIMSIHTHRRLLNS